MTTDVQLFSTVNGDVLPAEGFSHVREAFAKINDLEAWALDNGNPPRHYTMEINVARETPVEPPVFVE